MSRRRLEHLAGFRLRTVTGYGAASMASTFRGVRMSTLKRARKLSGSVQGEGGSVGDGC